jgi:antibiotic biosynthesis monooxygenase (ABM) superfamily enzyme
MPQIKSGTGVVTQVNLFIVTPGNQQPLIDLLIEAARSASDVPGWMSASIHRSHDGTRVVNYAQCTDMAAWNRVMEKLHAGKFLERNKQLGVAHPGLYEVVFTLESS